MSFQTIQNSAGKEMVVRFVIIVI